MGTLEILQIKDKPDGGIEIAILISQEGAVMSGVISYPPFAELSHLSLADRHFILGGTAIMEFLSPVDVPQDKIDKALADFIDSARH